MNKDKLVNGIKGIGQQAKETGKDYIKNPLNYVAVGIDVTFGLVQKKDTKTIIRNVATTQAIGFVGSMIGDSLVKKLNKDMDLHTFEMLIKELSKDESEQDNEIIKMLKKKIAGDEA